MPDWTPFREPIRATLLRTGTLAIVLGAILARSWGGVSRWPIATIVMLWPALGGHLIELWFLNWLRPRIAATRGVQIAARIATWFVGGIVLVLCMGLTARAFANARPMPTWWQGALAFIGIELVAHVGLQLRGRPSFYNGRG